MPRETRIQKVVDHAEAIIGLLEEMAKEARARASLLPAYDSEAIAFLEDFAGRAEALAEVVEDEIISGAIGLNNLAGPLYHLLGGHS